MLQYTNRVPVVGDKVYLILDDREIDTDRVGSILALGYSLIKVAWNDGFIGSYEKYDLAFAE